MTNPEQPHINTDVYRGPEPYTLPKSISNRLIDARSRAKQAFSQLVCKERDTTSSWEFGAANDVFVYKTSLGSWGETSIFAEMHHRTPTGRIFDVVVRKQNVRLNFEDELASAAGRGEIARAFRYDPYKAIKIGEKKLEDEKLEYFEIPGIV